MSCALYQRVSEAKLEQIPRILRRYSKKATRGCLERVLQYLAETEELPAKIYADIMVALSYYPMEHRDLVHNFVKRILLSASIKDIEKILQNFLDHASVQRLLSLLDSEAKQILSEKLESSLFLLRLFSKNRRKAKGLVKNLNIRIPHLILSAIPKLSKSEMKVLLEFIKSINNVNIESLKERIQKIICSHNSIRESAKLLYIVLEYLATLYGLDRIDFMAINNRDIYFIDNWANEVLPLLSVYCSETLQEVLMELLDMASPRVAGIISIIINKKLWPVEIIRLFDDIIARSSRDVLRDLSPALITIMINVLRDKFFEAISGREFKLTIEKIGLREFVEVLHNIQPNDFSEDPIIKLLYLYKEKFCRIIAKVNFREFLDILLRLRPFERIPLHWSCVREKMRSLLIENPRGIFELKDVSLNTIILLRILVREDSRLRETIIDALETIEIKELSDGYGIPLGIEKLEIRDLFRQTYPVEKAIILTRDELNEDVVVEEIKRRNIREITNFVTNIILLGYRDYVLKVFGFREIKEIILRKIIDYDGDIKDILRFLCVSTEFGLIELSVDEIFAISEKISQKIRNLSTNEIIETVNNLSVMSKYGTCLRHTMFYDSLAQRLSVVRKRYKRLQDSSVIISLVFLLGMRDSDLQRIAKNSSYGKLLRFISGVETIYVAFKESKLGDNPQIAKRLENIIANEYINMKVYRALLRVLKVTEPEKFAKKLVSLFHRYSSSSVLRASIRKILSSMDIKFIIDVLYRIIKRYEQSVYSGILIPLVVLIMEILNSKLAKLPEESKDATIRRIIEVLNNLSDMMGIRKMLLSIIGR